MIDSSWLDPGFWGNLITQGFLLGALIGAIVGSISWTVMERGSNVVFLLTAGALIGLVLGVYIEGRPLLQFVGAGSDAMFESPGAVRALVFSSVVGILQWLFGVMALACFVASTRRAFIGTIIGGLLGTITGMVMVLLASRLIFSLQNPLTTVLIALSVTLLIVLVALGQAD